MDISRKQFVETMVSGGTLLLIAGCGGGGSYGGTPAPAPAPAPANTCNQATISDNHGHVLAIPKADLDSMTDKTYDIQGTADHTHSVTFTVAQLAALKAGMPVGVQSTTTLAHSHLVTETCT